MSGNLWTLVRRRDPPSPCLAKTPFHPLPFGKFVGEEHVNFLSYSKHMILDIHASPSPGELLLRFQKVLNTKRVDSLVLEHKRLVFKNLYLNRLDLLPIPCGWIQVEEKQDQIHIYLKANYRWRENTRGKILAISTGAIMLLLTFYKSWEFYLTEKVLPSFLFFAIIPLYLLVLWLFVFGLNSLYTRVYFSRWIRRLALIETFRKN